MDSQSAYEARHKIASGGDPAMEKRKQKIRAEFLSAQTFEAVAREYIDQMMVQSGRADLPWMVSQHVDEQSWLNPCADSKQNPNR